MIYDTLDKDHRHSAFSRICTLCAHRQDIARHTCAAFPDGIPDEIWNGENDHTQPYPGDRGVLFERRKPKGR
jgi:hypothetical protein